MTTDLSMVGWSSRCCHGRSRDAICATCFEARLAPDSKILSDGDTQREIIAE